MDAKMGSTSRRDVLKGVALAGAGVLLQPVIALAENAGVTMVKGLPRSSASALGIKPEAIVAFIDEVNAKVGGLHSMMLVRHGKVAAEAWWSPFEANQTHMLYSLSKSFTSTAVGFVVAEGLLKVEDKVVSFFPDKLPATVSENLAAMRVKDLLTMSTGHEVEPGRDSDDWVKSFLAAPVPKAPGSHFLYNTSATHVLSAIVQKVSNKRLLTFLTPRLFEPLGIEGATWEQSPAGVDAGGYGLKVKTEDIAKLGLLYLQKGKYNGKQLLPEAWVEEATQKQVSNGDPTQENDWSQGYGYQFWRCRHNNYRGDGAFGQYCVVMPAHDAVLAITSGVPDMGAVLKAMWDHLLPGMTDSVITGGDADLRKKLESQHVPAPVGSTSSEVATSVSGRTYQIAENADGIKTLRITFTGDKGTIEIARKGESALIPFGTKSWVRGKFLDEGGTRPIATRGAWTSDRRFEVTMWYLDAPHAWFEAYEFDGDQLKVDDRHLNVWFAPMTKPALVGKK